MAYPDDFKNWLKFDGQKSTCVEIFDWIRQLDTWGTNKANAIAVDGSGNVYVAGETPGDAWVAKYNAEGAQQWIDVKLGSPHRSDVANAIAVDGSGNVYVAGKTKGEMGGPKHGDWEDEDAWLAKYDAEGTRQWVEQLGTSGTDSVTAIAVDGSGNVYVAGTTVGKLGKKRYGGQDAWLAKYDAKGTEGKQRWIKQVGSEKDDVVNAIAVDGSGNVYVAGKTGGTIPHVTYTSASLLAEDRAWLAKYNAQGAQKWIEQLVGRGRWLGRRPWREAATTSANAIAVDGSGNVYVAGTTTGELGEKRYGGEDAWLAKYEDADTKVEKKWAVQLGSSTDDVANALAVDGSGNVYVAGKTRGNLGGPKLGGEEDFAVWLAKYSDEDTNGARQWIAKQVISGDSSLDSANAIAVADAANVYIAGAKKGGTNLGDFDAWVAKFHQLPRTTVDELTVQVWVKPASSGDMTVVSFGGPSGFNLKISNSDFVASLGNLEVNMGTSTPELQNPWIFLCVTWKKGGDLTGYTYVDVDPIKPSPSLVKSEPGGSSSLTLGSSAIIGRKLDSEAEFFDGAIAQVAIWSKARSKEDINTDTQGITPTANLLGWWPLNEGTGIKAMDHSGNANHGIIDNGKWGYPKGDDDKEKPTVLIQVTHNPFWEEKGDMNEGEYEADRLTNPRHIFLGMPTPAFPQGEEVVVYNGDTVEWLFPTVDEGEAIYAESETGPRVFKLRVSQTVPYDGAIGDEGTVDPENPITITFSEAVTLDLDSNDWYKMDCDSQGRDPGEAPTWTPGGSLREYTLTPNQSLHQACIYTVTVIGAEIKDGNEAVMGADYKFIFSPGPDLGSHEANNPADDLKATVDVGDDEVVYKYNIRIGDEQYPIDPKLRCRSSRDPDF